MTELNNFKIIMKRLKKIYKIDAIANFEYE